MADALQRGWSLFARLCVDPAADAADSAVSVGYEDGGMKNGRMLYRVGDFALPTLAAIGIEFSRLPSMFGLIRKFSRCAVLADQSWIKMIGEIEGALIPGLEIKGFSLDEEAEAEAWLSNPSA